MTTLDTLPETSAAGTVEVSQPSSGDDADVVALGYKPKLHRTMGAYTSFALAFSMVSINTGIVTLFADPFSRIGGVAILLWLLVIPMVFTIVAVYAHLAGRIPLTGYAYQWSSRLAGFVIFALLGMAIPGAVGGFLDSPANPVFHLVGDQFGRFAKDLMVVIG